MILKAVHPASAPLPLFSVYLSRTLCTHYLYSGCTHFPTSAPAQIQTLISNTDIAFEKYRIKGFFNNNLLIIGLSCENKPLILYFSN